MSGQFHAPIASPQGKEPPGLIGEKARWAPEPVWTRRRRRKIPAPAGNRTPVFQPVVSHYSDWASPAAPISAVFLGICTVLLLLLANTLESSVKGNGFVSAGVVLQCYPEKEALQQYNKPWPMEFIWMSFVNRLWLPYFKWHGSRFTTSALELRNSLGPY